MKLVNTRINNFMLTISYDQIKNAIDSSNTMREASIKLNLHFSTFKRKAEQFGLYSPNQGCKGGSKIGKVSTNLNEILDGKHPHYQTFKLKNRLLKEGLIENKCSKCNITEWDNMPINCELDHINGIRHDHRLSNLRMLCPNCHSQTSTYRGKNVNKTMAV
jgi:hypothetical protein